MIELSAEIRLRPTRIGFLVRPNDLASVKAIMRANAVLWGGIYNPIIPVYRSPPPEWREDHQSLRGRDVGAAYVGFFEPDVYVEAESGLLEAAGLAALRGKWASRSSVASLREFLKPLNGRNWSEPSYGLNAFDIYRYLHKTEQRFLLRDKNPAVLVKASRTSGVVEALFGDFPKTKEASYLRTAYVDTFKPEIVEANPTTWLKVYKEFASTPLRTTRFGLDGRRYWHHELSIFIFDPTKPTDLIDLWNARLEPSPILPVPLDWLTQVSSFVRDVVRDQYKPIRGNPQGLMHHTTLRFGASIPEADRNHLAKTLAQGLPQDSIFPANSRTDFWNERGDYVSRPERLKVTSENRRVRFQVRGESDAFTATFDSLTPEFASDDSFSKVRWVNAVSVSNYSWQNIATDLPFNTFDTKWPRIDSLGEPVLVGTEGWVFRHAYKNWSESINIFTGEKAVAGWLEKQGITATLSEPGRIAKQMIGQLGSLWDSHILSDASTLHMLNSMATSVRRKQNDEEEVEETFHQRTLLYKTWVDHLAQRKKNATQPDISLKDFTDRNIIRLGLETECSHCGFRNWHSLSTVDYAVICDRCLKSYPFPQAQVRDQNRNWYFRVVGPFSVPDFGRGSYGVLLALNRLNSLSGTLDKMAYSTGLDLKFDGISVEVDFLGFHSLDRFEVTSSPRIIVGESKSFGKGDLISPKDLKKLRAVGEKLPGAVIVISVMRDKFTAQEKQLLLPFVKWGSRPNKAGAPTNPVILLTGNELFSDIHLTPDWEKLGDPWKKYSDFRYTSSLQNFAEATQGIYLGLPSFVSRRVQQRDRAYKLRRK